MGIYIEATKFHSKLSWLVTFGAEITTDLPTDLEIFTSHDMLPVCLVNNGAFLAAAVAYSQREYERFQQLEDTRPKKWYAVKISNLELQIPNIREFIDLED